MDINTITLDIQNGTAGKMWVAIFSGPHAADIQRLFGTTTIPTPFAASTLPMTVWNTIVDQNPGAKVRMRGDSF